MSRRETEVRELLIACDSALHRAHISVARITARSPLDVATREQAMADFEAQWLATYGPKQNFMGRLPNLPDQDVQQRRLNASPGNISLRPHLIDLFRVGISKRSG